MCIYYIYTVYTCTVLKYDVTDYLLWQPQVSGWLTSHDDDDVSATAWRPGEAPTYGDPISFTLSASQPRWHLHPKHATYFGENDNNKNNNTILELETLKNLSTWNDQFVRPVSHNSL